MKVLSSENYAETMRTDILPQLMVRKQTGTFERVKGQPLFYEHYRADHARGTLVLVHGFSESIAKFREMVWYFLQDGLNVWLLQQREHGKSFRSTPDRSLIYIEDYNDLVEDLHFFITRIVQKGPDETGPLYLYAHSMGGGVSACLLGRYPLLVRKALLSSPMLQMSSPDTPVWAARLYSSLLVWLGRGKQHLPGSAPFSDMPDFENSCAASPERYAFWFERRKGHPEEQMSVCAVRTALQFLYLTQEAVSPASCKKITAPVLLMQAGNDTVVGAEGQALFIARLGSLGQLMRFPKAKHEIYLSQDDTLQTYLDEVLAFLR